MNDFVIKITKEYALECARRALQEEDISVIDESLDASYSMRKLGIGELDRGWVIYAKLALGDDWDPVAVYVYVSDPDGKILIPPIL